MHQVLVLTHHKLIYLDDLFLFLPTEGSVYSKFNEALAFIRSLWLPVNFSKLLTPNTGILKLAAVVDAPPDQC